MQVNIIGKIPVKCGLFQRWTATLDSVFNVRISHYCVRRDKSPGVLVSNEATTTAGLIDDAVQAAEIDKPQGKDHAQKAADIHLRLDNVKTIYSTCKFTYLNRIHWEFQMSRFQERCFRGSTGS